jgi:ferredoxin
MKGLGLPTDKIRFAALPSEEIDSEETALKPAGVDAQAGNPPIAPATFSPGDGGRTLVRLATQHLYDQSGAQQPRLSLPTGSPFGAVAVTAACTLCLACAAACPSGALSASGSVPQLLFRESECHQCGLCKETCPEGAIRLLPRLLCDPKAVETRVVLREAEALRCIECGVPFGSQVMIDRIKEKLRGHWMYANERQIRRLQMCGTCRARDTLASPEMSARKP